MTEPLYRPTMLLAVQAIPNKRTAVREARHAIRHGRRILNAGAYPNKPLKPGVWRTGMDEIRYGLCIAHVWLLPMRALP